MAFVFQLLLMILAAVFEVGGDALIRRGITGGGSLFVAIGFAVLGTYGVIINLVGLDFSRMLGAYVGWFAVASVLFGRFVFAERISPATWAGLAIILIGALIIQVGPLTMTDNSNNP